MLPRWGPPGSCRPQLGPMLVPWTLLSGSIQSYILIPRRPNAYGLPNRYRSPVGTAGLVRFIKASVGLWKQRYLKLRMRSVSDISLCSYVVSHENKSVVREAGIKRREQVITSHNIYGIHLFVLALDTCSIWHNTPQIYMIIDCTLFCPGYDFNIIMWIKLIYSTWIYDFDTAFLEIVWTAQYSNMTNSPFYSSLSICQKHVDKTLVKC